MKNRESFDNRAKPQFKYHSMTTIFQTTEIYLLFSYFIEINEAFGGLVSIDAIFRILYTFCFALFIRYCVKMMHMPELPAVINVSNIFSLYGKYFRHSN